MRYYSVQGIGDSQYTTALIVHPKETTQKPIPQRFKTWLFLCGYITDIVYQRIQPLVHCGSFLVVTGKFVPIQVHTQVTTAYVWPEQKHGTQYWMKHSHGMPWAWIQLSFCPLTCGPPNLRMHVTTHFPLVCELMSKQWIEHLKNMHAYNWYTAQAVETWLRGSIMIATAVWSLSHFNLPDSWFPSPVKGR